MNCIKQSKMIKPKAKSCYWCKHMGFYTEGGNYWGELIKTEECWLENIKKISLKHRLELKMDRENDFRYCQHYRFSKENFLKWKREYNTNQSFLDNVLGTEEMFIH